MPTAVSMTAVIIKTPKLVSNAFPKIYQLPNNTMNANTTNRALSGTKTLSGLKYKIVRMINQRADTKEIMKIARLDGMMTLREVAIKKLAQGVTTFEEVVRVTSE